MEKLKANYAFKPIAEQALGSNQTIVPQRLNAALGALGVIYEPDPVRDSF